MATSDELISSFNEAAELYDKMRPLYPDTVIDQIVSSADLKPGSTVFEIGCGTGQLTVPLAKRNFKVTAIDRGEELVRLATYKCRDFPNVEISNIPFEEWHSTEKFDLITAAQVFHWLEPVSTLSKVSSLLLTGSCIALIWNLQTRSRGTEFWELTQPIYSKYFPPMKRKSIVFEDKVFAYGEALGNSKDFTGVKEIREPWDMVYSAEEYINLLNTYSDHRVLSDEVKPAFF